MRYIIIAILSLLPVYSYASTTTISAQVVRNQAGSGTCLVSSGFPFPPGLVDEKKIADGNIKVIVHGYEVAANISALRGRHSDGTLRSALIQFTENMGQGDVLTAQVIVNGGARTKADPAYIRPSLSIITNNNVIVPTDPSYIVTTEITWRGLLPAGSGTPAEEKLYTALAEDRFDALVLSGNTGTARYEEVDGMLSMWARTGNIRYLNQAISYSIARLGNYTPGSAATPACNANTYVNPDGRTVTANTTCGLPSEWNFSLMNSFASEYLLTGYRDFWSIVAYNLQQQQSAIISQSVADTKVVPSASSSFSAYDTHRYNYSTRYGCLIAATMIDATFDIPGQYYVHRKLNFSDQYKWTLQALINAAWNFKWLPFNNGEGVVPAYNTIISEGGVSATLLGVYTDFNDSQRFVGQPMPTSGYLMVTGISGGDFSAGTLSGISANATGGSIEDYRNGMTGVRSNSPRVPNIGTGTAVISGTTMTVTAIDPQHYPIIIGKNISGSGIAKGTFVVSQSSGTEGGIGVYEISSPCTLSTAITITYTTCLPVFQLSFLNNFLIDYYLRINADARIPAMVAANVNIILDQISLIAPRSYYDQVNGGVWGNPMFYKPYSLANPVGTDQLAPYELPEFARMIAFVIKTIGDQTVNGKLYSEWYNICVDTANISPIGVLTWQWKIFGQFFGWGIDAPWMMAQSTLPAPIFREPTYYSGIPGDTPDLARATPKKH